MPEIYQHSFIFRRYSFERAARRAKEYGYDGLELFAGHFRLDHLWEDLEDVRRISREVGIAVPAINLHSHVIGDDSEERRQLAEVARRAGLLLTLEVHMNPIHDTAATARRLVDAIDSPAVRANL